MRIFPDFEQADETPPIVPNDNRSRFAYSSPFQVFSKEGLRVLEEIIKREENHGEISARGHKIALRGLYYMSPWVRDLQACQELKQHFKIIAGEELVPHPSFCNSPQVKQTRYNSNKIRKIQSEHLNIIRQNWNSLEL